MTTFYFSLSGKKNIHLDNNIKFPFLPLVTPHHYNTLIPYFLEICAFIGVKLIFNCEDLHNTKTKFFIVDIYFGTDDCFDFNMQ